MFEELVGGNQQGQRHTASRSHQQEPAGTRASAAGEKLKSENGWVG